MENDRKNGAVLTIILPGRFEKYINSKNNVIFQDHFFSKMFSLKYISLLVAAAAAAAAAYIYIYIYIYAYFLFTYNYMCRDISAAARARAGAVRSSLAQVCARSYRVFVSRIAFRRVHVDVWRNKTCLPLGARQALAPRISKRLARQNGSWMGVAVWPRALTLVLAYVVSLRGGWAPLNGRSGARRRNTHASRRACMQRVRLDDGHA